MKITSFFEKSDIITFFGIVILTAFLFSTRHFFTRPNPIGCFGGYEYEIKRKKNDRFFLGERIVKEANGVYVYKACVPEVAK